MKFAGECLVEIFVSFLFSLYVIRLFYFNVMFYNLGIIESRAHLLHSVMTVVASFSFCYFIYIENRARLVFD